MHRHIWHQALQQCAQRSTDCNHSSHWRILFTLASTLHIGGYSPHALANTYSSPWRILFTLTNTLHLGGCSSYWRILFTLANTLHLDEYSPYRPPHNSVGDPCRRHGHMSPTEQCARASEIRSELTFVLAGADFFDGSAIGWEWRTWERSGQRDGGCCQGAAQGGAPSIGTAVGSGH
jgi:hypothetical protein